MNENATCPTCHITFTAHSTTPHAKIHYCPFCRSPLDGKISTQDESSMGSISFLEELVPQDENIQFSLGPYRVLKSIGKGGMGEVFLAYDTICGRQLAIKQIRPDLLEHKQLHNRFLKEARITSQLTHPAIIPIYNIHNELNSSYYTMPYVEGRTLKEIIKREKEQESKGRSPSISAESIPTLIRTFLSICQAIAYAHSKKVLHRDLKPENIIVGQYGQIVILDWGLAKLTKGTSPISTETTHISPEDSDTDVHHHLTRIGKVVGTVAYMAPERAIGIPADFRTDIYALGVILYQLLTLHHPFHRRSLKWFRQHMHQEKVTDPSEIAPYRDVPPSLSRVVMKCIAFNPESRYQTVDGLIHDLESYIEGKSEWFQMAELRISNKKDWEFQENVFIAEHIALTRGADISNWVGLMISRESFQENVKIEARVKIGHEGHGIGFLFNVPEAGERRHLNDGYCLWIASDLAHTTKLTRSTVEVMQTPEVTLTRNDWHHIRIERVDNHVHFFLNDTLQFSYISHLPMTGTHIGLLTRDADFTLEDFKVYIRSPNVTINCLAVPDAFLAHRDYATALSEYRRIGYSFHGRAEGREAMFRAGITLLEQGNNTPDPDEKQSLYNTALEEFYKLHNTPGAPLEYLGKALVYRALNDTDEESKCYELAFRRYSNHPLLPILYEHVVYRMHESSRVSRKNTYDFLLLALRFMPEITSKANAKGLLSSLERHWERLPFFIMESAQAISRNEFIVKLAFWLAKPYVIMELIKREIRETPDQSIEIANAFWALLELGSSNLAQELIQEANENLPESWKNESDWIAIAILSSSSLEKAVDLFVQRANVLPSQQQMRAMIYLMEKCVDAHNDLLFKILYAKAEESSLSQEQTEQIQIEAIWNALQQESWKEAGDRLQNYPIESLSQDTSIIHMLYGCWLMATEGKEIASIHFSGLLDIPYPRTWSLLGYFLKGKIDKESGWQEKAFLWERRQLYRQLSLYSICLADKEESLKYQKLAAETYVNP